MATKSQEKSLKSFLREATLSYAEGAYTEKPISGGLTLGEYESGNYFVEDTYRVSEDERKYSGREEVYKWSGGDWRPIWVASYYGAVLSRFKPGPVLEAYKLFLLAPNEELPIRGPRKMKIGQYEYNFDSTQGPINVGRFAVIEELRKKGVRVYRGDIAGGWI